MVIPMDLSLSHQVPRGPMTRSGARALETEVTSFLIDIPHDPLETWLLPKSGILCMIRYQENPPEDAREDGQVPKFTEEENQWKESRTAPRPRTSGHDPGHPAPGGVACSNGPAAKSIGPGHSAASPDIRPRPGNPTSSLEIWTPPFQKASKPILPERTSGPPARTSGSS